MRPPNSFDLIIRGRCGEPVYALANEYDVVDTPVDLALYGLVLPNGSLLDMAGRAERLGLQIIVVRNGKEPANDRSARRIPSQR